MPPTSVQNLGAGPASVNRPCRLDRGAGAPVLKDNSTEKVALRAQILQRRADFPHPLRDLATYFGCDYSKVQRAVRSGS